MGELPPTLCPGTWSDLAAWAPRWQQRGSSSWQEERDGAKVVLAGTAALMGWRASVTKLCSFPPSRKPQGTPNTSLSLGKYCPGQTAAHSAEISHKHSLTV